MKLKNKIIVALASVTAAVGITACTVSFSLSGASIPLEAQTVSVSYFPNTAPMVATILSPTFTDALQERMANQTRLSLVQEDGDLHFEGEIVGYTSTPTAVTADEYATQNRLTITVRVRFVNRFQPEFSFPDQGKTFSAYMDYNSNQMLTTVEGNLIPEIVDMLVDDIFNSALANW